MAWLWIDHFIWDCICHDILSNVSSEAGDVHFECLAAGSFSGDLHSQWYHETTVIWSSLIEHENLLCCQSDRLCISSLMDAPFNYSCASLLAISMFFYIQDLESGSTGGVADLRFFNRGVYLCSPIFCGERGFFRGGRWKKDLMNGDSQNGGCGSLKTQARWIELRLTGTWPLSSLTQTRYICSLRAGGTLHKPFDFFFFFFVLYFWTTGF